MRNFLNFMGKSLMILVFSFLTLSVVLTSCSPSDDSEVTSDNLVTNLIPNDQNYVRTGDSDSKPILRLNQNDLTFSTTITGSGSNLVELSSDFKEIKVKSNILPNEVGMKNISYTILRNGSVIGGNTINFEVSFGKLDVTLKRLVINPGFEIVGEDTYALYNNITIKNVPWQYVLNGTQDTYKFQFVLVNNSDQPLTDEFNQETYSSQTFIVCKLVTDYNVTNPVSEHITISEKTYNNEGNKKLYELKVRKNNDNTYEFIPQNGCSFDDATPNTPNTFYFNCNTQF